MNTKILAEKLDATEKEVCIILSEFGLGLHTVTPEQLGIEEFDSLQSFVEETYPLLELCEFVKFHPFTYSKKECYMEDIFLKTYHKLLLDNKIEEAKQLASLCDSEVVNLIVDEKIRIENFNELHKLNGDLLANHHLGYDLTSFLVFQIEVKQELIDYVKNYITPFLQIEETGEINNSEKTYFNKEDSCLIINHKKCPIRKFSKQYDLLSVIFTDTKKDWQFSEVSENLDFAKTYNWKRLHNTTMAINSKVVSKTHFDDFFITTTQSVKINPAYLNNKISDNSFGDF